MATSNTFGWLFLSSCAFLLLIGSSNVVLCQSVPGLYAFGDSLIDPGNNNYLYSLARADFYWNGIDFPTRKPTGRFSNGKNAADFLAEKVGLPLAPPYLSLSENLNTTVVVTGVSFASGGSGIFNETGISLNGSTMGIYNGTDDQQNIPSIPLAKQVEYYSTIYDQLVQQLNGSANAEAHLSKSLFLIVIGSNDVFAYFNKDSNLPKQYTPQQYVDLMASNLKGLIKKMHGMGARKFVVTGVGVIGCSPAKRILNNTECITDINYWSVKSNDALQSMLTELKYELSDINYSYFHLYDAMNDIIQHPQTYGFTEIRAACCGVGNLNAENACFILFSPTLCPIRENHLFWDLYHPTETASGIFADIIYSGSGQFTTPMNVEQLVKV